MSLRGYRMFELNDRVVISKFQCTGGRSLIMGRELYVGNLSYSADEEDLRSAFGEFGSVETVNIVTDRETGRSRGFGFVKMSTDDEAQKAITGLGGKELKERALVVNEARPREQKDGGPRGGGGGFKRSNRY